MMISVVKRVFEKGESIVFFRLRRCVIEFV